MKIRLVAVGAHMPAWVATGFQEYQKRLPKQCSLELVEVPAPRRTSHADIQRLMQRECEGLLKAVPAGSRIVALDVHGKSYNTEQLAAQLNGWLQGARDLALLVGGPDGLSRRCLAHAEQSWSLSDLTLPHQLVRIVVAEQLYRAWSILAHSPYHRSG